MSALTPGQQFQILAVQADLECCLAELMDGKFENAKAQLLEAGQKIDSLALEVGEFKEQPQPKQLTIELPHE